MLHRFATVWLPLFLLVVTTTAGLAILTAVAGAASLDEAAFDSRLAQRLQALFAHDVVVRRTAVVSGVGLLVTAIVFFRPRSSRAGNILSPPPAPPMGA